MLETWGFYGDPERGVLDLLEKHFSNALVASYSGNLKVHAA